MQGSGDYQANRAVQFDAAEGHPSSPRQSAKGRDVLAYLVEHDDLHDARRPVQERRKNLQEHNSKFIALLPGSAPPWPTVLQVAGQLSPDRVCLAFPDLVQGGDDGVKMVRSRWLTDFRDSGPLLNSLAFDSRAIATIRIIAAKRRA